MNKISSLKLSRFIKKSVDIFFPHDFCDTLYMRTNIVPNEIIKIVTCSDKTYLDQLITTYVVIDHDISVISLKISVNYYFQQKNSRAKNFALPCPAGLPGQGSKKNFALPCPCDGLCFGMNEEKSNITLSF